MSEPIVLPVTKGSERSEAQYWLDPVILSKGAMGHSIVIDPSWSQPRTPTMEWSLVRYPHRSGHRHRGTRAWARRYASKERSS